MNEKVHEHFPSRLTEERCIADQFAPDPPPLQFAPRVHMRTALDGREIGKCSAAVADSLALTVPLFAGHATTSAFIVHRPPTLRGDNDMIDEGYFERASKRAKHVGDLDIVGARRGVAARVVVDKKNARRIMLHCTPENCSRMESNLREASPLELLVGNQSPARVEKKDAQNLVGEASHRNHEIATERRVGGIDPFALKIAVHRCKDGAPRRKQKVGYAAVRTEHARKCFRGLRPDTADRPELVEQSLG